MADIVSKNRSSIPISKGTIVRKDALGMSARATKNSTKATNYAAKIIVKQANSQQADTLYNRTCEDTHLDATYFQKINVAIREIKGETNLIIHTIGR